MIFRRETIDGGVIDNSTRLVWQQQHSMIRDWFDSSTVRRRDCFFSSLWPGKNLREIWKRHKKRVYFTIGVLGSGYLLYKLYDAHKRRLSNLERELAQERENDEFIKAQMQAHFGKIQRIVDTATLPHSMLYLSSRVAEEQDLLHLTEPLIRGKGQSNSLSSSEKLELWEKLKILSFTRMVLSLWAMAMLSLYIRVQVNILGRHLYIDTASDLGSSHLLVEESKFVFEARIIQRMELLVLSTLQWKINSLTPLSFVDHIVRRFGLKIDLHVEFLWRCMVAQSLDLFDKS